MWEKLQAGKGLQPWCEELFYLRVYGGLGALGLRVARLIRSGGLVLSNPNPAKSVTTNRPSVSPSCPLLDSLRSLLPVPLYLCHALPFGTGAGYERHLVIAETAIIELQRLLR